MTQALFDDLAPVAKPLAPVRGLGGRLAVLDRIFGHGVIEPVGEVKLAPALCEANRLHDATSRLWLVGRSLVGQPVVDRRASERRGRRDHGQPAVEVALAD